MRLTLPCVWRACRLAETGTHCSSTGASLPAPRSGAALAPGISLTLSHLPRVPRGLFREAADTWQRLAQVPAGSSFDAGTGATRTPLAGPQRDAAILRVSTELAPASIALTVLTHNGAHLGRTGPRRAGGTALPFCIPLGHAPGSPHPLGVSLASAVTRTGVPSPEAVLNFAVTSEAAQDMVLHLQWGTADDGGELELALDRGTNRTGHTWHVALPAGGQNAVVPWAQGKVPGGLRFGWRAGGGGVCSLGRVCVDPYALVLTQPAFEPPCPPGMAPPPALGDILADVALRAAPFSSDAVTGPALGVRVHQSACSMPCSDLAMPFHRERPPPPSWPPTWTSGAARRQAPSLPPRPRWLSWLPAASRRWCCTRP